ncbi:hypothetical protein HHI36_022446 [Cryptolaemus montrouzieri]|uniref:Uncharacterized protein n=1 Tax=Cryptolaemus montrouzieri TaxID=559131 RepID=A0ABD2N0P3_9CUCU
MSQIILTNERTNINNKNNSGWNDKESVDLKVKNKGIPTFADVVSCSDVSSCRYRKRITNNMVLVGSKVIDTADHANKLFVVSNPGYIHVYRFNPDTDEEDFNLVKSQANILKCEKLESRNEHLYASFKLTIAKEDIEEVLASEFWPYGICVREFFKGGRG